MPHTKTPHYYAVILTHESIDYGDILNSQPEIIEPLKKAIFEAAKKVFLDAACDGIAPPDGADMEEI